MKWFRMYYEARNDAKLKVLTDRQFRIWFNLLCYAAEHDPTAATIPVPDDRYLLAVETADGNQNELEDAITALQRLQIIHDHGNVIQFINYEKRQHDKPSDSPSRIAERVRKHRKNKRNAKSNADVTPCNATEEIRTDQEQEKSKSVERGGVGEKTIPPSAGRPKDQNQSPEQKIKDTLRSITLHAYASSMDEHNIGVALDIADGDAAFVVAEMERQAKRFEEQEAKKPEKLRKKITRMAYFLDGLRDAVECRQSSGIMKVARSGTPTPVLEEDPYAGYDAATERVLSMFEGRSSPHVRPAETGES